jgi:chorismate synthase
MLRYLTAGESHGKCLTAILEGMPAGLKIDEAKINNELARRQKGYGRGGRMAIEKDTADILSGLRNGETIGSPIAVLIKNNDFLIDELPELLNVRPGHADLAGILKYKRQDARDILERSSARETAVRVAVGAIVKQFLAEIGIQIISHVVSIGNVQIDSNVTFEQALESEKSEVRCVDKEAEQEMINAIDSAKELGSSLGGIFEVIVHGHPVGLGSYVQWDRKLNAKLAYAIMGIQAIKGIEIGSAFENSGKYGHETHDEIVYDEQTGYSHKTNNAGGIEGGMSNGEDIIVRGAMKPIPTLTNGLNTVNIKTKETVKASAERSDVCAVPAACVVAEAVVAIEIANAFLEKFGGDSIEEIKSRI